MAVNSLGALFDVVFNYIYSHSSDSGDTPFFFPLPRQREEIRTH